MHDSVGLRALIRGKALSGSGRYQPGMFESGHGAEAAVIAPSGSDLNHRNVTSIPSRINGL